MAANPPRPRKGSLSTGTDPDRSARERAVAVAMFRYELIREAADAGIPAAARGRTVRAMSQRELEIL